MIPALSRFPLGAQGELYRFWAGGGFGRKCRDLRELQLVAEAIFSTGEWNSQEIIHINHKDVYSVIHGSVDDPEFEDESNPLEEKT
jgi:hypothetical protein